MNNSIKISIITISYNAEKFIRKTIKSVIYQNYNNVEYIVIDGSSKDGTVSVIKEYSEKIDYFVSESDNGISDAFNKGLKYASGDLICFLNAGDVFINNNIISDVVDEWSKNKTDVIFYKMKVGSRYVSPNEKYNDNPKKIWENMEIPHQACFCRKNLFNEIGNFNVCIGIRMDFDFFARCVKQNRTYKYIPKVITLYDDTGVSSELKNRVQFASEALYIKKLYHLHVSIKDYLRIIKWKLILLIR